MEKCYLDSNFLIYYKNEESDKHTLTKEKLKKIAEEEAEIYISPLIIDEFLQVFHFLLKRKGIKPIFHHLEQALQDILALPKLNIINPPIDLNSQLQVVTLMENYNLHPRDAYHLLIMQINKIDSFATFDEDFRKVFAAKMLAKI